GRRPESEKTLDSFEGAREYYRRLSRETGYHALCKMSLPSGLRGKRVLDVGCRRGKGVYNLAEQAGAQGFVLGVDWCAEYLDEARSGASAALGRAGLDGTNVFFKQAFPENLAAAGVEDGSFDAVFVNSVLNLMYDPSRACGEACRALTDGGLLVCQTVLADAVRDERIVCEARRLGNSVQSAPFHGDFEIMLRNVGFSVIKVIERVKVEPSASAFDDCEAKVAVSAEGVRFFETVIHAWK
ncbi:MAG: class I SAM-dependent methyltransferase, partial [Eggerthellaceae bacterium]|nr:class I SAM-dependent methyltransferase [Eggerthellaceae bacterium]